MILRTYLSWKNSVISLIYFVLLCLITSEAKFRVSRQESMSSRSYNAREANTDFNKKLEVKNVFKTPTPSLDDDKNIKEQRPTVHPNLITIPQPETVNNKLNVSIVEDKPKDFVNSLGLNKLNTAALLRGFYVFGGLGVVVLMYILVRTIRLRRKKTMVRKYGVLTNCEDLEMTPLGADDDEDTTIFDLNNHPRT